MQKHEKVRIGCAWERNTRRAAGAAVSSNKAAASQAAKKESGEALEPEKTKPSCFQGTRAANKAHQAADLGPKGWTGATASTVQRRWGGSFSGDSSLKRGWRQPFWAGCGCQLAEEWAAGSQRKQQPEGKKRIQALWAVWVVAVRPLASLLAASLFTELVVPFGCIGCEAGTTKRGYVTVTKKRRWLGGRGRREWCTAQGDPPASSWLADGRIAVLSAVMAKHKTKR